MVILFSLVSVSCAGRKRTIPPQVQYHAENEYMDQAIGEARDGIYNNDGGPFGSVIVKDGKIVGKGHNCVLSEKNSTRHGEMCAIQDAEKNLDTYDLSGCVLYTTGEPCMMCLAACIWANIDKVYYGCTIEDNSKIGFRDGRIDDLLGNRDNLGNYLEEADREACLELFEEYSRMKAPVY